MVTATIMATPWASGVLAGLLGTILGVVATVFAIVKCVGCFRSRKDKSSTTSDRRPSFVSPNGDAAGPEDGVFIMTRGGTTVLPYTADNAAFNLHQQGGSDSADAQTSSNVAFAKQQSFYRDASLPRKDDDGRNAQWSYESSLDSYAPPTPIKQGVKIPKAWLKLLNDVRQDSSVKAYFEEVEHAFNLVYLGNLEVGQRDDRDSDLNARIKGALRRVVLAGSVPRAVTLLLTNDILGIVDRQHRSETIARYRLRDVLYHSLKELDVHGDPVYFITLVGRNNVFNQDTYYVLECKPTWPRTKVDMVWDAVSSSIFNYNNNERNTDDLRNDDVEDDLAGDAVAFTIPKFSKVYHVKYMGSKIIKKLSQARISIAEVLERPQHRHNIHVRGQKQGKSLKKGARAAKAISFAQEAVLVVAPGFTRILDSNTMAQIATVLPTELQHVYIADIHEAMSRSKNSAWDGTSSNLKDALKDLDLLQQEALARAVAVGDLSEEDAIREAKLAVALKATVLGMVWMDEQIGVLRCGVVAIEGNHNAEEAERIQQSLLITKDLAGKSDPFEPADGDTGAPGAGIEALQNIEIDRSDILAVKLVGSGFFGEVYLASELVRNNKDGTESEVRRAVKTLRPGASPQQAAEFLSEAAIQAPLDHPAICKVTGVCTVHTPYLCVLEFVSYGDLQGLLMGCKEKGIEVTLPEQLDVARQTASGLKYLHELELVHLDIAARNILVGPATTCKIADFGLTRPYDEGRKGFKLKGKMTIPQLYAPPETFPPIVTIGQNIAATGDLIPFYSEDSDMWAFGVLLWEIATYGAKPYGHTGKGLVDNLKAIYFDNLRLSMPDSCSEVLAELMDSTFAVSTKRPTFAQILNTILKHISSIPGGSDVRDIGMLVNDGLEQRLKRVEEQASGLRTQMKSQLAGASRSSKWAKVRIMIPFFSMGSWKQFDGKLVRVASKASRLGSTQAKASRISMAVESDLQTFYDNDGFNPIFQDDDDLYHDSDDEIVASEDPIRKVPRGSIARFGTDDVDGFDHDELDMDLDMQMFVEKQRLEIKQSKHAYRASQRRKHSIIAEEGNDGSMWI